MTSVHPPPPDDVSAQDLRDLWTILSAEERTLGVELLAEPEAEAFFAELGPADQAELVFQFPLERQREWMRALAPDDTADLLQEVDSEQRRDLLALLDEPSRKEVNALLAYEEDAAGGLMNPRYARLRPDMTVDEAISYLRRQARERLETIYYVYVLDERQHLLGVVSFRELFAAQPSARVRDVMRREVLTVHENLDQESVSRIVAQNDLYAIPVVDDENRIKGIVTVDDIVDVVQEEATEDIQKLGGMQALEAPYLKAPFMHMIKKRAGWLSVLCLGEMLTATALANFEDELAKAVVLSLFMPVIIASGGNSGSQASTLVIRAMALGELELRDFWRVIRRELGAGVVLGAVLGSIGFMRIVLWEALGYSYGAEYMALAMTLLVSLIGVVICGTLAGALLPFVLRKLGADPASASAPLVATLVDVTGLILYLMVARSFMQSVF